jgi:hypothetical protein
MGLKALVCPGQQPIIFNEGQGKLLAVKISEDSPLVGRRIEETFD